MVFNAPWLEWLVVDENFKSRLRDDTPKEIRDLYEKYLEFMEKEGLK